MIGPEASALGFAFSSSAASATRRIRSSRSSRPCALLRRDQRELRVAAPILGLQTLGGEVRLDPVGVGVREVDLVHGDDDRHLGGARVRSTRVCGITESSAATTRTAMSVTLAPRAAWR